jgi:PAS domain S-box-containing protein
MLMPYTSSENGTYTEIIGFAQDITEKRLTKSQLELREQELSEIQNIAKVGNWTWSMNTGQIEWTQSINRIIGLPKELYPESLEDMHALFEEKSAKKLQKAHSLILKKGGMYEEELEIQHSGMSKKMLLANGKVIYDENGSSVGISGTIRDITDLRNIQEHLVSSERRLSAATKGADIGIWEFNIESKLIFMNATTKELLDIKTAASFISYKQILALMPLEDSLRIKQTYFGQTSSQIKFGFSIVSQGKEKMFEVAATLYYARIPEKAKYTGVIIDVTKRKVTENRVSLLNAQVTAILANSPSAIFVKSPNGIIEMMSNAGKEWWGENCEGLADEDILDPSIQEVSRQGDITVLQNQKPVTYEVSYPYQAKTKVLLVTKFPIFYNENEYHVGGVATDITILKQNEVALIEAKEKAEESDRLKSAFLANMSHEIRTPLNSIIGFSDILKRQNLKEEDRLRFLAIINEQGKHLLNIINDIIDLSAIEANKLKLLSQQVDLNKLFDSIYNTFSERIVLLDKKNIDFIIEKELQGQLFVQTDSSRLTQILTNLVNNAIKFTEKGFVKLSYHVKDDTIQFSVRDSGVGISEDHLDTVFERFRQLDQSDTRKHGGTGLGLAITKSLVEIMGGKMAVESQLGYGTIFSCVLPMVAEQKAVNIPKKNLLVPDYTGRNIFVVEDDINSAFLLQTLLGNTKANVTHFILGSDVVKQCKEHPESVDVVLMDLQLPDITGYDATRAILAILPNAKIIAQSAQAMQSHKQKAFDAGCVDYLTKPIDMVKLFDVLRKYE